LIDCYWTFYVAFRSKLNNADVRLTGQNRLTVNTNTTDTDSDWIQETVL